jgi:hypothetical protein
MGKNILSLTLTLTLISQVSSDGDTTPLPICNEMHSWITVEPLDGYPADGCVAMNNCNYLCSFELKDVGETSSLTINITELALVNFVYETKVLKVVKDGFDNWISEEVITLNTGYNDLSSNVSEVPYKITLYFSKGDTYFDDWTFNGKDLHCLGVGSMIHTDQGFIAIENLQSTHTIEGNPVKLASQPPIIVNEASHMMVRISANALSPWVPNKDLDLTWYHMVYHPRFNYGTGIEAGKLVNDDTIRYIPYTGKIYNVLLKNRYTTMLANNVTVGTLPPALYKKHERKYNK